MQDSGVTAVDQQLADFFSFDPANNPGGFTEGLYDLWLAVIAPLR